VRNTTSHGVEGYRKLPALNVPRQCLLLLQVKVNWKEGKVLGNERGKAFGSELC
jgi:hypothetical protein